MNIKNILAGKFRRVVLLMFDCVVFACVAGAYYFAIGLFDHPHSENRTYVLPNAIILLLITLVARLIFGVYNSVWRYPRSPNVCWLSASLTEFTSLTAI